MLVTSRNYGSVMIAIVLSFLVITPSSTAETIAEHFKGRVVTIHMGFPGGGFFESAKLAAKHMQKYIPGNPNVVLAPRPGRLGTAVLDFLSQWAPKDGTHLAMPGSLGPWLPLQTNTVIKYDPLKMNYIGNINSAGDTYLLVRPDAGIKTLVDLKTKPIRVSNSRGMYKNFIAALNNILGTKITYVGDYPSHKDAFTAMLQGKTQGVAGAGVTVNAEHRRYFPSLLEEKKAIPILRYTSNRETTEYPNVILAGKRAATETQKQALEIIFSNQVLDRPIMGPPGIPVKILRVLQKAFMQAMNDPALISEAKLQKINIIQPMNGKDMLTFVKKIYAFPITARKLATKTLADNTFLEKVSYLSFKAELLKIKPKGKSNNATLFFKSATNTITVELDGRTTEVKAYGDQIKIPPFKVRSLNPGMLCKVFWTGTGSTAGKLFCDKK
ncbi:MAG: hypothetical protein VX617_06520 [Pseudomonadota bacterium]|nr:hypothetical protein [Pseudomonadota bacterium]